MKINRIGQKYLVLVLIIGLVFFASCGKNKDAIFVTLQGSDKVENIENKDSWTIPTAHYVAISPNGNYLLVSSITEPNVHLLDMKTGQLLNSFEVGPVPQGVVIGPDNQYGIAVSQDDNSVTIIDIKARQKVKTIAIGKVPHNAIFTKDGKRAYITLQGEGKLAILDMEALEKIDEFSVEGLAYPHNLDFSEDEKTIWVRDFEGKVAAVDVATQKVLAVIPVSASHSGIDVIASGRYVFTGGIGGTTVDVIDPKTFEVVKKIEVGPGSHGVRSSPNGDLVYISVTGTDEVVVIDSHALEVVKTIPTAGNFPFWIAVSGNP